MSEAEWRRRWDDAFSEASRPTATSATRLAEEAARVALDADLDGVRKDPRDLDLPPWQKGRYGSAIGRAVHGVLQGVDLTTGDGLRQAAAAQAAAEAIIGKESIIEGFCRSALASAPVREAAGGSHWREVYVGVPHGQAVLEGYVDLLYRGPEGLVIVDYKTDQWRGEADLGDKVSRYRVQLEAYATAVAAVTGEDVSGLKLLFLHPSGPARTIDLRD
jgi:hypothetical protein